MCVVPWECVCVCVDHGCLNRQSSTHMPTCAYVSVSDCMFKVFCVCKCVFVNACACMCVCVRMYVSDFVCDCIRVCLCICVSPLCVCVCAFGISLHVCVCLCVYLRVCVCVPVCDSPVPLFAPTVIWLPWALAKGPGGSLPSPAPL
ncbi:unnamed protein product [Gadus morhua 'NCC']